MIGHKIYGIVGYIGIIFRDILPKHQIIYLLAVGKLDRLGSSTVHINCIARTECYFSRIAFKITADIHLARSHRNFAGSGVRISHYDKVSADINDIIAVCHIKTRFCRYKLSSACDSGYPVISVDIQFAAVKLCHTALSCESSCNIQRSSA